MIQHRRFARACQIVIVGLGAIEAWQCRNAFDADGISYLDIGDAYWRGDWGAAINAYWGPIYSILLGLFMRVLRPSPEWEFTMVHFVNFLIYLWTLWCFNMLLREMIAYHQRLVVTSTGDDTATVPTLVWITLGYSLFIVSALVMIKMKSVSPDMMVSGLVYLIFTLVLRIYSGVARSGTFVLLGIILGISYLTKAAMLPLGLVIGLSSMLSIGHLRREAPRILAACAAFLLVVAPFVAALSQSKGRLTVGDTAKLAYAWFVNEVPAFAHWQGEPVGSGTPAHPTRELSGDPKVYEFAEPVTGTYPPWYDPSYWHEGIEVHFDIKQQLWRWAGNCAAYLDIVVAPPVLVIVGFLWVCNSASRSRDLFLKSIVQNWLLIVPPIAAFAMYFMVHVETRFVGPFFVLICFGIACGARVKNSESKSLLGRASISLLVIVALLTSGPTVLSGLAALIKENPQNHVQWHVADGLKKMGVRPGDKVAFIGHSFFAYWARLARVQIVAEIPLRAVEEASLQDQSVNSRILALFAGTGAKVVVTDQGSIYKSAAGWQQIGNTNHYVYVLNAP